MSRYRFGHVYLAVAGLLCMLPFAWAGPGPNDYTISPAQGVPGKTYGVVVQSKNNDLGSGASGATITALGRGLEFTDKTPLDCHDSFCTGKLAIASDAEAQQTFFVLTPKKSGSTPPAPILLPFSVIPQAPGPIPPGIDPSVDIAWKVMSKKVASDNFGIRISKLYYPIEVYIGNNSGYSLQVAGIYFDLNKCPPPPDADRKKRADGQPEQDTGAPCFPIPTDPYHTVRRSLETAQEIGFRNTSIHVIKALGPMLTGGAAFFGTTGKALHHKAEYTTWVDIFSNPFEKGMELIFPDETVPQLTALDNQTLRDSLIVSNNMTVPTVVFVDKRSVISKGDLKSQDKGLDYSHNSYDPMKVMQALGTLRLEGKVVDYIRRVTITSNAPKPAPPPGSITTTSVSVPAKTAKTTVTIQGMNLSGATVTTKDANIKPSNVQVAADGKSLTVDIDSTKAKLNDEYHLTVTFANGATASVPVKITSGSAITTKSVSVPANKTTGVTLDGTNLADVKSVKASESSAFTAATGTASPDGKSIPVTITVPKATKPGEYHLVVTFEDGTSATVAVQVK